MPVEIVAVQTTLDLKQNKLSEPDVLSNRIVTTYDELERNLQILRNDVGMKKSTLGFLFFVLNVGVIKGSHYPILKRENVSLEEAKQHLIDTRVAKIIGSVIEDRSKRGEISLKMKSQRIAHKPIK